MKFWRLLFGGTAVFILLGIGTVAFGQAIPGRYIVTLNSGASPVSVAASHGLLPDHVYQAAVNGFAGLVPPGRLQALQSDPRVAAIEQDQIVSLIHPLAPPRIEIQLHENDFETVPTGITRINAHLNSLSASIGIAIIDTGIDLNHPDLDAKSGYNATNKRKTAEDDHGHGTHVAGTAGAKGNSIGVRGVAAGATLWAVKVLDRNGSGRLSWVIAGVDWVTKNAAANGIKVANMSLGFQGTSSSLDTAIENSVNAGVTYVVAAGNSAADAALFSPANHPAVITVSAIGDSDGVCGGSGPLTSDGFDDTFASFSNFGDKVEIAAPGVDIISTWKGDLYATASGTSMASPHVAGAAALYIANNPGKNPNEVRTALSAAGTPQSLVCTGSDLNGDGLVDKYEGGFANDPDGVAEPLVDAQGL